MLFAGGLGVVLVLIVGRNASLRRFDQRDASLRFAPAEVVAQRRGKAGVAFGVGFRHAAFANLERVARQAGLTRWPAPAIGPPSSRQCCRSSVVERILGKAEVEGSIPSDSTIFPISNSELSFSRGFGKRHRAVRGNRRGNSACQFT